MKVIKTILFISICILIMFSCDQSSQTSHEEQGILRVLLTDAPGNYDAVYIDIREVRVHRSGDAEDGEGGWKTINTQPVVVDLLELTNGRYEILGEKELEPGRYNQMRLILGDQNEIVIDGEHRELTTPSAQQSGLKLHIDADIDGGQVYTLLLDFDASRSIVKAGQSGMYLLKPVIRTARLDVTGVITGSVEPAEARPWVYAIAGADTVAGTMANEHGEFAVIGLASGSYQVSVKPDTRDYYPVVISNVEIDAPDTTHIGVVELESD